MNDHDFRLYVGTDFPTPNNVIDNTLPRGVIWDWEYLEPENVYALPDGTIIKVDYNHGIADCPMGDLDIPVYAYEEPRLGHSQYANEPDDLLLRVFAEYVYREIDPERALELTQRYARVFLPPELAVDADNLKLGSWRGYRQGDWLEYVYISEFDMEDTFNLYLQNDISVVDIEYPNGDTDCHIVWREFGHVLGEDIDLDISQAKLAHKRTHYYYYA